MQNKVSGLQAKLSHAAKQSLDRKFGALYDKVYREDIIYEAWKKVRANKGAPGVDELDFRYIEEVIGIDAFLTEIIHELKHYLYHPQPVLRCWIEKPGKPEKRPLGIPIIKDRVVQMAAKLVIEPIFEADFLPCSYGFRPGRSPHHAIDAIRRAINFKKQTIVVDADIVGYFNNIRQDQLMDYVGKRISDPHLLRLIRSWLQCGVMEDRKLIPSDGMGTPQGGVISPLLANIYLHEFDKMFQSSGIPGTLVRFADDIVILVWRNGKNIRTQMEQMLKRLGLELHPDKTRIVKAEKGFDFLGVHFRLYPVAKKGSRLSHACRIWPSDTAMNRIREKLRLTIGRRYSMSLEDMIKELNPIIRGWNNYHRPVARVRKRLLRLNAFVRERLRNFLRRKYGDRSKGCRRVRGNLLVRLGLCQFG
jgi:group II intron reverse transcriptase/maturase